MSNALSCASCAAPLHPTGRSQRVRCEFCGADTMLDAATFAQLAAAPPVAPPVPIERILGKLHLDLAHAGPFLEQLATRLAAALPDKVRVEKKGGLFTKPYIAKLEVDLGEYVYVATLDGQRLAARRAHMVRGIALKNQELQPAELIDALAAELHELSHQSDETRAALSRFLAD
jgi:LSD1 subclass zinc finger protein